MEADSACMCCVDVRRRGGGSDRRRQCMTELINGLPQVRRIMTETPGPKSRELLARREASVARGVSTVLPVFIERAGGGVVQDVDGNLLIDLGSGIAVTSVGNAAERVVAAVNEQAQRFTHTC